MFTGTGVVTAGNEFNEYQQAQFNVIRDAVAPIVSVTAPTKTVSGVILVQWGATDGLSGPTGVYTVSVMTPANSARGRADTGPLQLWLGNTSLTSANFTPTFGHRYTFVVTATDNVRNTSQGTAATDAIQVTKYYYIGSSRVAMRRSAPTGTAVTYLHTDHLGTVSVATTASGQEIARTLNMPYGSARWISGTMPTDYGFTGQKDTGLGLVYLHARFYAPAIGRFLSPDTIVPAAGDPQSLNRYAYGFNNPLKYTDPSGRCPWCGALIGGIIGAIVGYGAQVVNNLQQGMDLGSALTTNISAEPIVTGAFVGATIGSGVQLVGTILGGGAAAATTVGGTAATAACSDGNCTDEVQAAASLAQEATTTVYRFANGPEELTSNLSRIADPQLKASLQARVAAMPPAKLQELANYHAGGQMSGHPVIPQSPFISTALDPARAAATSDFLVAAPRIHSATYLYQFSVPNSLIYYPTKAVSLIETEVLILADSLIPYQTGVILNPYFQNSPR